MRLAISADLHVDSYFGVPDPATGITRREADFLATARWVAEQARERDCEALVVAGDYVEARRVPPVDRVDRIRDALAAGPDRQVHLRGNHDIGRGREGTVRSLARQPGWDGFSDPGFVLVGDVAVCAIPHLAPAWYRTQPGHETTPDADAYRELAELYLVIAAGLRIEAERAGARAAILVGHQQLRGGRMTERQAAFLGDRDILVDPRALAAQGWAAVAFGHVHWGQTVIESPCPVVFVGAPERVDFAEAEQEKSFVVVDVDAGGRVTIERIPTPARPMVTIRSEDDFHAADLGGAIVRAIDLEPDLDTTDLRRELERAGAFWIADLRRRPVVSERSERGLAETLTAEQALSAFFADDPDRDALVERGRALLAEVA